MADGVGEEIEELRLGELPGLGAIGYQLFSEKGGGGGGDGAREGVCAGSDGCSGHARAG